MSLQHTASSTVSPVATPRVRGIASRVPAAWMRRRATVRPIEAGDAESLAGAVTTESVTRFIPPPPSTADRFRAFIAWAKGEQRAGRQRCFAIVPHSTAKAAGLIQVRHSDADASIVEWGFLLAQPLWGTGLFVESAAAVLDRLFDRDGVRRVEAHTAIANHRGMGVLRKLGFTQETEHVGLLAATTGTYARARWTITRAEWRTARHRFIES